MLLFSPSQGFVGVQSCMTLPFHHPDLNAGLGDGKYDLLSMHVVPSAWVNRCPEGMPGKVH